MMNALGKWAASTGGLWLAAGWAAAYALPLVPFRVLVCSALALLLGRLLARWI